MSFINTIANTVVPNTGGQTVAQLGGRPTNAVPFGTGATMPMPHSPVGPQAWQTNNLPPNPRGATLIPEVRNGKAGFLNVLTGIWTETIQPIIDNKTDAKLKAMRTIVIGASVVLIAILILVFAFKKKKRK